MLNVELDAGSRELPALQLSVVVCDDPARDTNVMHNPLQKLDRSFLSNVGYRFGPYPFGEGVNSDKDVLVPSFGLRELADNVNSPDGERPRQVDGV